MDPESGWAKPISILMVVVFPAPFGPRKPKKQALRDREREIVNRAQSA